jgi:hypothetical protein
MISHNDLFVFVRHPVLNNKTLFNCENDSLMLNDLYLICDSLFPFRRKVYVSLPTAIEISAVYLWLL